MFMPRIYFCKRAESGINSFIVFFCLAFRVLIDQFSFLSFLRKFFPLQNFTFHIQSVIHRFFTFPFIEIKVAKSPKWKKNLSFFSSYHQSLDSSRDSLLKRWFQPFRGWGLCPPPDLVGRSGLPTSRALLSSFFGQRICHSIHAIWPVFLSIFDWE